MVLLTALMHAPEAVNGLLSALLMENLGRGPSRSTAACDESNKANVEM